MFEIRFHGRGGQGAVTGANIFAIAASYDGYKSQAFPFFGVERRGAPVTAYARISEGPIEIRSFIYNPDAVVVLDPSLLDAVNVLEGLKKNGYVLINTTKKPDELGISGYRLATVDASAIAVRHGLGTPQAPIVNTAILGALVRFVDMVKLESLLRAIREHAPAKKEENAKAAEEAYGEVRIW